MCQGLTCDMILQVQPRSWHLGVSGSPQWMTGVCFMVLPASFSLRDGWGATVTAIPEHHGFCWTPQLILRSRPVVKTLCSPLEKTAKKSPAAALLSPP